MIRRFVALGVLGTVLAAGCGGGGEEVTGQAGADLTRGKELFVSGCGSCHALADADTTATVGPNLDDAFGYSREQGFDDSSFFDVTRAQIDLAAPPMPANIYKGQDAVDVAAYVAACAGPERDDRPVACTGPPPASGGATEPAGVDTAPAETAGGGAGNVGKEVFAFAGKDQIQAVADYASAVAGT